jgi:hypothetical protein
MRLRKLPLYVAFPDRFNELEVARLRGFKPAAAASDELIFGGTGTAVDVRLDIECVNNCDSALVNERVQLNAAFKCDRALYTS